MKIDIRSSLDPAAETLQSIGELNADELLVRTTG